MPPEAPRGTEPESASFEAERVGGRRTQQPVVVLVFVAALAGIVAVGAGGRGLPGSAPVLPGGAASPSGAASDPASAPARPARGPRATPPPPAPLLTSGPGPIQLAAQRSSGGMFVHGDVFVPRVTWVYVSLYDDGGNVAGWASVSVPGAAGPGQGSGPTLRFDVELALPTAFAGRLWISANAYDDAGTLIAGARIEAAPSLRSRIQVEP